MVSRDVSLGGGGAGGGGGANVSCAAEKALYSKNKQHKRVVEGIVGAGKKKRPDSQQVELLNVDSRPRSLIAPSNGEVHIGFRKLSYSVREGIFRNRRRRLLKEINGDFHAGELTAIMGPSGSGKSTLMNILAGYTNREIKGKLFVNDMDREEEVFRRRSCYIMQDDNLQPLLTVMEAMHVAANLNLGAEVHPKDKRKRIVEILHALGLWECRKVQTKNLSGGQRKRLSIALELLKNPQVMFFDEPTSGLDSSTTKQCVSLLKQLAQEGKTVICTIHQPSASVFEMFDHLYAIADGRCIYQGSIKGLIPYLEQCGLQCPSYHNPADYLLEVATGEYGSHTEHLMGKSENGLCTDWRKNQRETQQVQSLEHVEKMMQSGLLTPVKAPSANVFRFSWYNAATPTTASPPHLAQPPAAVDSMCDPNYSTSFFYQLYVLLKRTFLVLGRDRTLTFSRIATHVAIAFCIGVLYPGIGHDASNMLNNFKFMFFTVMFLMLTAFNCITTTFPSQLPIVVREHFNQWYSLGAYYLAVTFVDIPIQALATLLYAVMTYFMTSQPYDAYRFLLFLVMCILISLVSQSFGMVIGACMDVKNGVIFGPFLILPFVIFSGFFVQLSKAHPYMQWLFHTSFLKYSFEGLMLAIFGYDRPKLPCEGEYCHFVYPQRFLEEMDMSKASYSQSVYFLVTLVLLLRILAYIALIIQIRRRR